MRMIVLSEKVAIKSVLRIIFYSWQSTLNLFCLLTCYFFSQNQSMIGQQMRQITPNQPYTPIQASQVSVFVAFLFFG